MKFAVVALVLLAGCTTPSPELKIDHPEPEQCGDFFLQAHDGYSILMEDYSANSNTSMGAFFRWSMRGPDAGATGEADGTYLVWGRVSRGLCDALDYEVHEEGVQRNMALPTMHQIQMDVPDPGVYYARAHLLVGDAHLVTPEFTFTIEP